MFDAQSLLGGLLKEATGSLGGSSKAALGMGALGVAIAAYEHFTQDKNKTASARTGQSAPPPPPGSKPVPLPHGAMPEPPPEGSVSASPPPVPAFEKSSSASPVPGSVPPPPPPTAGADLQSPVAQFETVSLQTEELDALLLIDAMLAAANCDGHIDPQEEQKIMRHLENINSDEEGFNYVRERIKNPPTMVQVASRVSDPETARQVYIVSLLAITVDSLEEKYYIKAMASALSLDEQTVNELNNQFLTEE